MSFHKQKHKRKKKRGSITFQEYSSGNRYIQIYVRVYVTARVTARTINFHL